MTTPFTRGLSRVLMIATVKLFQQSNAGPAGIIAPGQVFWADGVDSPGLVAGNLATIAPGGTPAPPPEPPFTVNAVPGLGAATANSSPPPPRLPITVTAAQTINPDTTGTMLRVKVLTGTYALQPGGSAVAGSGSQTVSVTTTRPGSRVYGTVLDNSESTGFTFNAASFGFDAIDDPGNNASYGSFRSAAATVSPGPVSLGTTDSASGARVLAAVEILPWGTITEDASSPAVAFGASASTVTTAPFLPPAGSLLVAMVCAESHLAIRMALSTVGLAWTEQVAIFPTQSYAGVWTAPVTF